MPILASSLLGIDHDDLTNAGVFDGFVDLDSALHVDPHLLAASEAPEFNDAYTAFQNHFVDVLKLIQHSNTEGDALWRAARKSLTFPELPGIGLGYAKLGRGGSAIGKIIATGLVRTARDIIHAGISDPAIFELAGLFEDNVGPDRISDMTLHIILPQVASFTQRIAETFGVSTETCTIRGLDYQLPVDPENKDTPFFLLPQDVLRDLPIFQSWSKYDEIAQYNADLRNEVNQIIGESWKAATSSDVKKEALLELLIAHPELMYELIERYKAKPAIPYDFSEDPAAEQARYFDAVNLANAHPLVLNVSTPLNLDTAYDVVVKICHHFGQLLENNGLNELLYDQKKKPLRERAAQRLFFGIASSYCIANGLDLSPESNAGRGPIDFKVSGGSQVKIAVEMKLSSHSRIRHGYEQQLPIYMTAENAKCGLLLVVRVNDKVTQIEAVQQLESEAKKNGDHPPRVIVVDARLMPSASK